uniref:CCHC-type domain-containing protein n=1 Tax=Nicotiana tabacum TaxID=4097 RepID=A0A1S3XLL6_TOBAC|nr:PREDICTED: uncharacterized protein LOC107766456 [Nicotiana tabacum]
MHNKVLLPEYQLFFELVNKVLLPHSERRSIATKSDMVLMEALDKFVPINLPAIMIDHMQKLVNFKERVGGSISTISQMINAQNVASEEIRRLRARNAILETQLNQAVKGPDSVNEEVARLTKENDKLHAQLLEEQLSANARLDLGEEYKIQGGTLCGNIIFQESPKIKGELCVVSGWDPVWDITQLFRVGGIVEGTGPYKFPRRLYEVKSPAGKLLPTHAIVQEQCNNQLSVEGFLPALLTSFLLVTVGTDRESGSLYSLGCSEKSEVLLFKEIDGISKYLIDTYYSFVNDKDALIIELGDAEQSKDDLMVVVVDLKETIEYLRKEKNNLVEKITTTEKERDDMVVSIVDLREQVEEVTREHNLLKKQTKKWMDNTEGEEVASEAQLELKKVKTNLVAELEKNRQLQEDLKRVKNDLDKSLKWTRSSDVIMSIYSSNGGNRQGIGFQKAKTSYNPYRKYVTVDDNRLCTHCGQIGHYKDSCKVKIQSLQKNKVFVEKRRTDEEPGSQKRKYVLPAWAKRRDLSCLSAVNDNVELWHKRLGYASFTLLNKLVKKDLVRGLLNSSFKDHRIEPKNIKEAFKDVDWITTMQEELCQLERNSVWNLVPRPAYRTVIGARLPVLEIRKEPTHCADLC